MADYGLFTATDSFDSILQVSEVTTKPVLTKVACTLGPCSQDFETLKDMLLAGMGCARIDFSWGDKDYHRETMENLMRAVRQTMVSCAIMLDTSGTEIHCYNKSGGEIVISKGQSVTLTCDASIMASSDRLPLSIESFDGLELSAGTDVFVGQYLFTGSETTSAYITVTEVVDSKNVVCIANDEATLAGSDFIISFSRVRSSWPILSKSDEDAIRIFGRAYKIHFISVSLTRDVEDIRTCRSFLNKLGMTATKILAKIESITALQNFSGILDEADGILISRGLLGLDIAAEKMFRVQNYVIQKCNQACKPVIVTRVMDSMTHSPRPTRAEATDIANLVLEGVDCFLLGAETFRGEHPLATMRVVQDIAKQAEMTFDTELFYSKKAEEEAAESINEDPLVSLAHSAVRAASLIRADLVIVFTVSGRAARILSKFRPAVPILSVVFPKLVSNGLKWTFTGELEARQLLVSRGCVPILADPNLGGTSDVGTEELEGSMLNRAIAYAYSEKWIQLGSRIVLSQHAKKNMDYAFQEMGVFKVIVLGEEVLDSAVETYKIHRESVQWLKKTMFSNLTKAPTFKGVGIHEMPRVRTDAKVIHPIPERNPEEEEEEEEEEEGGVYEFSDVPETPEETLLNQQVSQLSPHHQRRNRWFSWRRH